MSARTARCTCGALAITVAGDPIRISACHCRACQRRTGSAFSVAVFYERGAETVEGSSHVYIRLGDSGQCVEFHFCPDCGSSLFWYPEFRPNLVGVAIGCFGEDCPGPPTRAVYEQDRHDWVAIALAPGR